MKDKGSCKTGKYANGNVKSYRYVCTSTVMKYTEWSADNCLGEAEMTYVYPWNKCVEFDNEGHYVYVQSAIALKSAVVATALALFSANF